MGWGPGYDPKCGDGPHDFVGFLDREAVGPWLLARFGPGASKLPDGSDRNFEDWERVGVIQLVLEARFSVPVPVVREAVAGLERIICDDEWAKSWREPARHVRSAKKWLKLLRAALDRPALRMGRRGFTKGKKRATDSIHWSDVFGKHDLAPAGIVRVGRSLRFVVKRVPRKKAKAR